MTDLERLIQQEDINIDIRPNQPIQNSNWSSWTVTLKYGQRKYVVPYFTQFNAAPTAFVVLSSLLDEIKSFEATDGSFEQWASKNNFNLDSRSAYATWENIVKAAPKLKAFLGSKQSEFLKSKPTHL